jgi:hypothetical protein
MVAEIGMLLADALDSDTNAVRHGFAHPLHRIAHLSGATPAVERLRKLHGENIDLAADGIRTLKIRPVQGLIELGSKLQEPGAVLAFRARIEDIAAVWVAPRTLVQIVPPIDSDSGSPQARPPLPECGEMRDMHLLIGMEQQILQINETLQRPEHHPRTFIADAQKLTLIEKERCLRRSARRNLFGIRALWNVFTRTRHSIEAPEQGAG